MPRLARPVKRLARGRMNPTEAEYAVRLWAEFGRENVLYESLTFRLADRTTYTPDFLVLGHEFLELHEVKGGFFRDDARAKWKISAELFPMFRWIWSQKKNGSWKSECYGTEA